MNRFRMRYLSFSLILCIGCASDYKMLQPSSPDQPCIDKLKPAGLVTSWYDASIDVVGKHISGLLLIKNMPDSTNRIVFTNEAGFKFLDFEFAVNGSFKVHHVIRQLDKKPVIRLLKKDFELMLGIPFRNASWKAWRNGNEYFYGVHQKKEMHYFITDKDCASLQQVESGSERKRMVSLIFYGPGAERPDSIQLKHHTFAMQIRLRKLARD
jgi:hypothetical protein